MPRTGHFKPESFQSRIHAWLLAHPGMHSCAAIADGLGVPPDDPRRIHRVAVACGELLRGGRAARGRQRGAYMGLDPTPAEPAEQPA